MKQVVITFVGICTHVQSVPMTPPPDAVGSDPLPPGRYHRTIMVNGRLGMRLGTKGMPPHEAYLVVPNVFLDGDPGTLPGLEPVPNAVASIWRMEGVTLYVPDAVPGMELDDSFTEIPSLTDRAGVLSLQLDPRVVVDGRAAGRFDVFAGRLAAFRHNEAVFADLTVDTVSDSPRVNVTRTWDQQTGTIRLKDGLVDDELVPPQVFVMNVGRDADEPIDFLMHYEVTTFTPDPDAAPGPGAFSRIEVAGDTRRHFLHLIPGGLTVGCSNSVYP